jgi:hypothetical protein
VKDGKNALALSTPVRSGSQLDLHGYRGAKLVAARKLALQ